MITDTFSLYLHLYPLKVVDAVYDCKSEVIGPGFFRFKAEIGKFTSYGVLSTFLANTAKFPLFHHLIITAI